MEQGYKEWRRGTVRENNEGGQNVDKGVGKRQGGDEGEGGQGKGGHMWKGKAWQSQGQGLYTPMGGMQQPVNRNFQQWGGLPTFDNQFQTWGMPQQFPLASRQVFPPFPQWGGPNNQGYNSMPMANYLGRGPYPRKNVGTEWRASGAFRGGGGHPELPTFAQVAKPLVLPQHGGSSVAPVPVPGSPRGPRSPRPPTPPRGQGMKGKGGGKGGENVGGGRGRALGKEVS